MLHKFIHSSRAKFYRMTVLIETRGQQNTENFLSIEYNLVFLFFFLKTEEIIPQTSLTNLIERYSRQR